MSENVKPRFALRYSLLLFGLVCLLVSMLVSYAGIKQRLIPKLSSTNQSSTTGYGVAEVKEAVAQIELGVSTLDDIESLIGPYVESRDRYRLKDTGKDRIYYFVPRERQIWLEFSWNAKGEVIATNIGKLEPRATWIGRWEGGYLTFSPSESPW